MEKIAAIFVSWLIGLPIYLPWVLARLGLYKRWYFAPFIPPFSWRGWIQAWPMSAFLVFFPIIAILPIGDDQFTLVLGLIGGTGIAIALFIMVWTPRWAKPAWQRRLEDRFSHEQISEFIRTWRKLLFSEWCELIETEKGMLELVDYAIENHINIVDEAVRLRTLRLANAKERRLKEKPKWDI